MAIRWSIVWTAWWMLKNVPAQPKPASDVKIWRCPAGSKRVPDFCRVPPALCVWWGSNPHQIIIVIKQVWIILWSVCISFSISYGHTDDIMTIEFGLILVCSDCPNVVQKIWNFSDDFWRFTESCLFQFITKISVQYDAFASFIPISGPSLSSPIRYQDCVLRILLKSEMNCRWRFGND